MRVVVLALIVGFSLLTPCARAQAPAPVGQAPSTSQPPPPPPPPWSGSLSAGMSLTSGNKSTQNYNVSFDLVHDPKTRNVLKMDGLYLRGKSDANVTGDQLRLGGRDQYTFDSRGFVFAQARYLRDRFKSIDYFVAPSAGVGLKLVRRPTATLDIAGGIGGVWEQDRGVALPTSGSVTFDEKLMVKVSPTLTVLGSLSALWKTNDFDDALYTLNTSLAAAISRRAQLKVELLDLFKNKPATATIKRNDVTVITGLVYKF